MVTPSCSGTPCAPRSRRTNSSAAVAETNTRSTAAGASIAIDLRALAHYDRGRGVTYHELLHRLQAGSRRGITRGMAGEARPRGLLSSGRCLRHDGPHL